MLLWLWKARKQTPNDIEKQEKMNGEYLMSSLNDFHKDQIHGAVVDLSPL